MPKTGPQPCFSFTHISAIRRFETELLYFVLRRAAVADGGLLVRMKYHVYSVLANISAALPCISNWSSGLPRVTGQYDTKLLHLLKCNYFFSQMKKIIVLLS